MDFFKNKHKLNLISKECDSFFKFWIRNEIQFLLGTSDYVYSAFCFGLWKDIAWESIQVAVFQPQTEY